MSIESYATTFALLVRMAPASSSTGDKCPHHPHHPPSTIHPSTHPPIHLAFTHNLSPLHHLSPPIPCEQQHHEQRTADSKRSTVRLPPPSSSFVVVRHRRRRRSSLFVVVVVRRRRRRCNVTSKPTIGPHSVSHSATQSISQSLTVTHSHSLKEAFLPLHAISIYI